LTAVPLGVVAFHDGTSWVNDWPGRIQEEVQREYAQVRPACLRWPTGLPMVSDPSLMWTPSEVPFRKAEVVVSWRKACSPVRVAAEAQCREAERGGGLGKHGDNDRQQPSHK